MIRGQRLRVFKNTPPSLRALFDARARARRRRPSSSTRTSAGASPRRWPRRRARRGARAPLRRRAGRPRRDRDAQLPGVDRRVRRDHLGRRRRRVAERVVDRRRDSTTACATRAAACSSPTSSASSARRRRSRRSASARSRCAAAAPRCRPARSATRTRSRSARRCPTSRSIPHADATILYTSGTTGRPKGAVSTHRAVLSALLCFGCQAAVRNLLDARRPTTQKKYPTSFILAVPLFHVTGCVAVMLSCFARGLQARDDAQVESPSARSS